MNSKNDYISDLYRMIAGDKKVCSKSLVVGKASGVLVGCGAEAGCNITITKKVVDKAMRAEIRDEDGRMLGSTGHGLTTEQIIQAISNIDNPIIVFKGKEGSLLLITDVRDYKERFIVIAIELKRQEGFEDVVSIRSIYGRDNLDFYIGESIEKGNLLAANKEKADEMLRSIGKSYPKENTFISFI